MSVAALTLQAHEIADSRGRGTVRVEARLGEARGVGDVPAGASKGEDEARTVPLGRALANVHGPLAALVTKLSSTLDTAQPASIITIDQAMAAAAGANFADLGANSTLPVSRALWALCAARRREPLWATLRQVAPQGAGPGERVHFYMNIFNGGLHALRADAGEQLGRDRIAYQEIMVVPVGADSYAQAMQMGEAIDRALKQLLGQRFGADRVSRADEAGFSELGLGDSDQAVALVVEAVGAAGLEVGRQVKLALDVAAGSFYDADEKVYRVGKTPLSGVAMVDSLVALVDRYPGLFLSIEDGLGENDWEGWAALTRALTARQVMTVGDDLFVTQMPRLRRGIAVGAANAVLIKVNQNGTVSGTLDVMRAAGQANMCCIVSHRSGETLDDSIADLAHACRAFGLKTGDPQPPEDFPNPKTWVRRAKYLRMIAIERLAGAA